MRKYSAYGQDDRDTSPVPNPPQGSPDLPGSPVDDSPNKDDQLLEDSSSDDYYDDNDEDEELKSLSTSELGKIPSLSSMGSRSLIFQIPTAEVEYASDDEESVQDTPNNASISNDRVLSADYVEKSEVFLDELALKQEQETEELSEMFNEMMNDQLKVDDIDLRSVLSTPTTARRTTNPTTQGENSGLSVVNISMDNTAEDPPPEGSAYEAIWVEEQYVPRFRSDCIERSICLGFDRFQSPKRRVQSAKTTRRQEEDGFVLKGRTFELLDAKDLAVSRRLSEHTSRESTAPSSDVQGHSNSCNRKTNEVN